MKSDEVIAALRARHPDPEWAFIVELRTGVGYNSDPSHVFDAEQGEFVKQPNAHEQRLDAWALATWPSKGLVAVTYEVKVSRADFLHELKEPSKRELGLAYSNEFYFATPKGLISPAELPPECGLVEVYENGQARVRVPAPQREMELLPLLFVAALARRAGRVGQMPSDRSVAERELEAARESASDWHEHAVAAQRASDRLAETAHLLLEARGWTNVRGNYRFGQEARAYELGDALRVELERETGAPVGAEIRFPTAAELEARYGCYFSAGADAESLLERARAWKRERGCSDLPLLAGAILTACLSPRNLAEQRGQIGLELVDRFLACNDHHLEGDPGLLRLLVQESAGVKVEPDGFAAAQLQDLIVAGAPETPFASRYPQLGLADPA